jgi:hypothetical protein
MYLLIPNMSMIVPTSDIIRYCHDDLTRYSRFSGAKYNSRATSSSQETTKKLPLAYLITTSPGGRCSDPFVFLFGSVSFHFVAMATTDDSTESRTTANRAIPSLCQTEKPKIKMDNAHPIMATKVNGPWFFAVTSLSSNAFSSCRCTRRSGFRIILTHRMEYSG